MAQTEDGARADDTQVTVRISPLELVEIDAWAAGQTDRPNRAEAVRRLVRRALGMRSTTGGHGMRPDELNAENDG